MLSYIDKKVKQECYGTALLQFFLVNRTDKRLKALIDKQSRVSLFDLFKGLPEFFATMPQSFHFYPKAKKMNMNSIGA